MDVEQRNIFDEIMEKMHQIHWWFSELAKQELNGVVIPKEKIQNYKPLNMLFEQTQSLYRNLQDSFVESIDKEKEKYDEANEVALEDFLLEQSLAQLLLDLEESYSKLNYISYKNPDDNKLHPSIYVKKKEDLLAREEFTLQRENLGTIQARIDSLRNPDHYTFKDKARIIESISLNRFYDGYLFDAVEDAIFETRSDINNKLETLKYARLHKLLEYKYARYFKYFNNKYNGFIQKGDYDKFGLIERTYVDETTNAVLGISEYEMEENVGMLMNEYAGIFHSEMEHIMRMVPTVRKTVKPKQEKRKDDKEEEEQEK